MPEDPTGAATLPALFRRAVAAHAGSAYELRDENGVWRSVGYSELGAQVEALARGLIAQGVEPGDRVGIFASTRPEWLLADYAALCVGATVVPIYHTSAAEEARHVLSHSGTSLLLVEAGAPADAVEQIRGRCPKLRRVLSLDPPGLEELERSGQPISPEEVRVRTAAVRPDQISTLMYTSGTTGAPKGCMLTHGNYRANTRMCAQAIDLGQAARIFVFLPFAHAMTRCTGQLALEGGHTLVFFSGDIATVLDDIAQTQPTHLPSVPRLFEKIHAAATGAAARAGRSRRRLVEWALDVGARVREVETRGGARDPALRAQHLVADRLVLRKVRALFGGQLRLALTGAAPIEPEILRFFHACGVLVLEGYGMTESSAAAAANTPHSYRFGTVGRPLPGGRIRVASDGEILMAGPHVFAGYYCDEPATRATLRDGWLHSGDLGELDPEGFLRVTGRKKEVLITSSGKNVTPAAVEHALRRSPLVAQAVVVGDRRPYLVALLELDPDETSDPADPGVRAALAHHVAAVNAAFAAIEQVKRFAVLPRALAQDHKELTPTMKVKRAAVLENWAELVENLYAERAGDRPSPTDDEPAAQPSLGSP